MNEVRLKGCKMPGNHHNLCLERAVYRDCGFSWVSPYSPTSMARTSSGPWKFVLDSQFEPLRLSAPVAQLNARPTDDQEVASSTPAGSATFFVEIDHEIFSTVILFLPLIEE